MCTLPLIPGLVPGYAYNLTVHNLTGATTLPAAMAFTGKPLLYSMTQREDLGVPYIGGHCQPGQEVRITGSGLYNDSRLSVQLSQYTPPIGGGPKATLLCLDSRVVDVSTVSCVLPPLQGNATQAFSGTPVLMQVQLGNVSTNALYTLVFASPLDPNVTSIAGCGQPRGRLEARGCRSGDVLTLNGTGMLGEMYTMRLLNAVTRYPSPPLICGVLVNSTSNTSVQCVLADLSVHDSPVGQGLHLRAVAECACGVRRATTPTSGGATAA